MDCLEHRNTEPGTASNTDAKTSMVRAMRIGEDEALLSAHVGVMTFSPSCQTWGLVRPVSIPLTASTTMLTTTIAVGLQGANSARTVENLENLSKNHAIVTPSSAVATTRHLPFFATSVSVAPAVAGYVATSELVVLS